MNKAVPLVAAIFGALCLCSLSVRAAGMTRVWVSGHGVDAAGCGAPTNPCRSLQYAHDVVAAGGEVDVLDPADYGAITITKSVSVVDDGVGAAVVEPRAAGENAVTIDAGPGDSIVLRGLDIDGLGVGSNGIAFNAGGSLTVANCVIRRFVGAGAAGNGVLIRAASASTRFLLSNVTASDNSSAGFSFQPASGAQNAAGVMDHVTAVDNGWGILVDTQSESGGTASLALSNSLASDNENDGINIASGAGPALTVSIDNVSATGNGRDGLFAANSAKVLLGRSVITANANFGVENGTSPNTLYTYGDNRIDGNVNQDISGALNPSFASASSLQLDNAPPAASIVAPSAGATISGSSVKLAAAASDASGIASVQLLVDGVAVGAAATAAPYATTLNSTSLADGAHTIGCVATDFKGATGSCPPIVVTSNNNLAAKTYYFAASGSDSNDCASIETPCQTIGKANALTYHGGDTLRFKGGDSFAGCLAFTFSNVVGSSQAYPFTVTNYGAGIATIDSNCPGANNGGKGPKSSVVKVDGVSGFVWDGPTISANGTATQYGMLIQNGSGRTMSRVTVENATIEGANTTASADNSAEVFLIGAPLSGGCGAIDGVFLLNLTLTGLAGPTSPDDAGVTGYACGVGPTSNLTNVVYQSIEVRNMGGHATLGGVSGNGVLANDVNGGTMQFLLAHDNGANVATCGGPVAVFMYRANNVVAQFFEAYNENPTGRPSNACDFAGLDLDGAVTNATAQYFYVHDNYGPGVETCGGCASGAWGPNTIRYGVTENNESALSGYGGELNLSTKQAGAGILYVYNMTSYNNKNANCVSVNQGKFASGVLANIICYMAGTKANFYADNHEGDANLTIVNNEYYNASSGPASWTWAGAPYSSLSAWAAASAGAIDLAGSIVADPGLASPGGGGTCGGTSGPQPCPGAYRLSTTASPAIGTGLNLTQAPYLLDVGARDYYGNSIPHSRGSGYNIGADGGYP